MERCFRFMNLKLMKMKTLKIQYESFGIIIKLMALKLKRKRRGAQEITCIFLHPGSQTTFERLC
jgi:hypothetical protein